MAWPQLSIRATVLMSIVVGVVLPALLVMALDGHFARRSQEPIVERNRDAVMVLAAAVITEPAWTLSTPAIEAAVQRILQEPSVCAVEVLDLQPQSARGRLVQNNCAAGEKVVTRETSVMHEGQTIARLRLTFDDTQVDRLLAQRRGVTGWLVAAQILVGVAVLAGVLSMRLLRPIAALKRQAGRLAGQGTDSESTWSRDDELGQLGQHLSRVHAQVRSLIEELEGKNAQLQRIAMYDPLTGLPNRVLLRELYGHEAANARRDHQLLALLFVDLDHFKSVNDTHGHNAGDEFLVIIARRLREALREADMVCRMGGDEFLVLLPRIESREQAMTMAERLTQVVCQPVQLSSGEPVKVGASIGIAMFPDDAEEFDQLVHAADVAMYRSKDLGRGRFSAYEAEMDDRLRARLGLERELELAAPQGQLRLFLQPMVDARSGQIVGAEALLRWQHPRLGLLTPDGFIAIAESTGAIVALGDWVLDAACAQLAAWQRQGRLGLHIAVNVSALQLHDARFAAKVEAVVRRHGVVDNMLTLELTESTLLADSDGVMRAVASLRAARVQLAIDDFGTGFSSLSALKLVRPDLLKIDRSFVRDLPEGDDDRALADAIFGMADALGIGVVAEGVETAAQRDWLLERGGWRQQGYLWSKPVPVGEFAALLDATEDTLQS